MIALSSNVLGEGYSSSSGPWCWIKDCKDIKDITKFSPVTWMAITGKFWEVLTYLGIFAIYLVLMWLKLKRYCRSRKVKTILLRSSKLAFNVLVKTVSMLKAEDYSKMFLLCPYKRQILMLRFIALRLVQAHF